jgi:hypothetical protein
MNSETIRQGLHNIRTRSATLDAVACEGATVIPELLPLLQDRSEGVRWSTITLLSEIGDNRAVGALIALLEQSKNVTDVANALRSITGQDFGASPEAWRRWAVETADIRNVAGANILSDEDLILAATRDLPAVVTGANSEYGANVTLPDGRTQQVWIDLSQQDSSDRPLVQLSTPCGQADEKLYESALKLNMSIPHGAIALAELDGALCFAMANSHLRETVHPEDIAESILSLAKHGDSLEQSLSGEDRY